MPTVPRSQRLHRAGHLSPPGGVGAGMVVAALPVTSLGLEVSGRLALPAVRNWPFWGSGWGVPRLSPDLTSSCLGSRSPLVTPDSQKHQWSCSKSLRVASALSVPRVLGSVAPEGHRALSRGHALEGSGLELPWVGAEVGSRSPLSPAVLVAPSSSLW